MSVRQWPGCAGPEGAGSGSSPGPWRLSQHPGFHPTHPGMASARPGRGFPIVLRHAGFASSRDAGCPGASPQPTGGGAHGQQRLK